MNGLSITGPQDKEAMLRDIEIYWPSVPPEIKLDILFEVLRATERIKEPGSKIAARRASDSE